MNQPNDALGVPDDVLINRPEAYTVTIGGMLFYGYSAEFRALFSLCRDFISDSEEAQRDSASVNPPSKSALSKGKRVQEDPDSKKACFLRVWL